MTATKDFRSYAFSYERIRACGKYLSKNCYWKLFAIENTIRIIIHSILSVQWTETPDWWQALAGEAKKTAERNMKKYLKPETRIFSSPGKHPLYFIYINDLNEIIRANSPYFEQVIPRLDKLILDIETLVVPRNIVAHMNYPNKNDQNRIDVFYNDLQITLDIIKERGIDFKIP